MKTKNGFTLIELLVLLAIVMILIGSVAGSARGCANVSHGSGEKIGQIVKLSKQGFIHKTWEGQLIRGGLSDGSGTVGTVPFDFTVEREDLVKKIDGFMKDRTEVVIQYEIEGIYSPFRSESKGHFVTSVEPAKNTKK